jgi:ferredoxin/flavodoxin---NADP+ reductase
MRKFRFEFQELRVPTGVIVENGRMVGVNFSRTEVADGQVRTVPDTGEEVRGEMTISSIGSIPEPIKGVPQKGEVYQYRDVKSGLLFDGPTAVFAAGNVLTGKGNIKDSLESGTEIGTIVAESYLGLTDVKVPLAEGARHAAEIEAEKIAAMMDARPDLSREQVDAILGKVRQRQQAVGYSGNYREWIAKVTPPDLQ